MAIFEVVRFEGVENRDWLLYKFPGTEFNTKSKLIVGTGQIAICVHNGKVETILEEGTFRMDTELLPVIKGFVKKVHGGNTPYTMEIYFINKRIKLDLLWGTSDPIKLLDPVYQIQIKIRARGQMGVRLREYQFFLQSLVGTIIQGNYVTFSNLQNYFRGIINLKVKKHISSFILTNKVSYFEVEPHIEEITSQIGEELAPELSKFGFELLNFSIESANVPEEDLDELNKIFHKKAEFEQLGEYRYRTARGYDVLEASANNEGAAGGAMGAGIGLGAGIQMAQSFQGSLGGVIPAAQQAGPAKTFACPKCSKQVEEGTKFCPECGHRMIYHCPKCNTVLKPHVKFCYECGEKVVEG